MKETFELPMSAKQIDSHMIWIELPEDLSEDQKGHLIALQSSLDQSSIAPNMRGWKLFQCSITEFFDIFRRQNLMQEAVKALAPSIIDIFQNNELLKQILWSKRAAGLSICDNMTQDMEDSFNILLKRVHDAATLIPRADLPKALLDTLPFLFDESNTRLTTENIFDTSFTGINTFNRTLYAMLEENSIVVPYLIEHIILQLPNWLTMREKVEVLMNNQEVIADFMWHELRYGYNGFFQQIVLSSKHRNLAVELQGNGMLKLNLSESAIQLRKKRINDRKDYWHSVVATLRQINEIAPNAKVSIPLRGLHYLQISAICPVTDRGVYDAMLEHALRFADIYTRHENYSK